jgi:feruloyl esterase
MMTNMRLWTFAVVAALSYAGDCSSLSNLKLPATEVTSAAVVPAGDFQNNKDLPEFCRVTGVIRPSSDSDIRIEIWMPVKWNGRFHGVGNGGWAGSMPIRSLADAIRTGAAAAGTDTGHTGDARDASWAMGHPEKLIDFGHRAIHEMTVQGKAIVTSYYGSAPRKSYFFACSNGGRQALMEAQRYPADYDGIIAGAPANAWTVHYTNRGANALATTGKPESYIPPSLLPVIENAMNATCDAKDGVKDGVIANPEACRPDLKALLLCKPGVNTGCLTETQIATLHKLYDGLRDARGNLLYPGFSPGAEAARGGWSEWITGEKPEASAIHAYANTFFKYVVYADPKWDYRTFQLDRDYAAARAKAEAILDSNSPDLSAFAARGGKLILYHGWCDPGIPPANAIRYYNEVRKKMGAQEADRFTRLYMIPGVLHCSGGPGTDEFGAGPGAGPYAQQGMAESMYRWIEKGAAPGTIIGAKYKTRGKPAGGVLRTRPICAYPKVAVYKGSGSTDDASNFACRMP